MADISINFQHPTDGKVISVTLDDTMTGHEVIGELIANEFIPASREGYNLAVKGTEGARQLDNGKTLAESQLRDNDTIRIIPMTDAGNLNQKK